MLIYIGEFIVFANRECSLLMAAESSSQLIGKSVLQFINPGYCSLIAEHSKAEADEGSVLLFTEERFIRLDESEVEVEVKAISIKFGNKSAIQLIIRDITDRKHRERVMLDILSRNRTAFQLVDKDGLTLFVNPAYINLFGAAPAADYSIYNDIQLEKQGSGDFLKRVKNGELVQFPDMHFHSHTSSEDFSIWTRIIAFPLRNKTGKTERCILMYENINETKKSETELTLAKETAEESDRLKSAFLANISHEIRTPMNGILGFSELLKESELDSEEQRIYIQKIKESGDRLLNIINEIIDMSRVESQEIKVNISETNINELIKILYTLFKSEVQHKGLLIYYKMGLPTKEAIIKTDREKIESILSNLLKNALKFTHNGFIEFGYEKKQGLLEFYIKDTGTGICPEHQEFIFERFRQGDESFNRNYEGVGLGLSISRAYVELLGGSIWVESEPGKGSVFYFTIPYNAEKESETIIDSDLPLCLEEHMVKNLNMLIAEDDEISTMLITKKVEKFVKKELKARTGSEAVEVCRNNPDIDFVLMDIKMPEMDGYEATRLIRQFNKDVIIIATTAFALKGDKERTIEAGCNDYISKPIDTKLLIGLIQKYFN